MSSWTPVPGAAGWGRDPGPGRDRDVGWGPHPIRVHRGLPLLQPLTCHWEPSGRRGTLSYCVPSHSSRFQSSCLVPGARGPVWSCTTALPPGGRSLHITLPLGYTASAATAQVAGQAARAKRPSCLPITVTEAQIKSINFWHSAFFIVQLSYPYMTTRETIALTRRTFVSKVTSLLFNQLHSNIKIKKF